MFLKLCVEKTLNGLKNKLTKQFIIGVCEKREVYKHFNIFNMICALIA